MVSPRPWKFAALPVGVRALLQRRLKLAWQARQFGVEVLGLRGGAEFEFGKLHLRGEVEWNVKQDRVASFETPVAAFTLVNLSAVWHPMGDAGPLTLSLAGNNLLNVSARRAASFTRDFVPLAGRDIRVSAKVSF